MLGEALLVLHLAACSVLALYGAHRLWLLVELLLVRRRRASAAADDDGRAAPTVTVQLPLYNERGVCERLVDAVCALEHPRDRFQVQVLDDSTDDTADLVAAVVARHRARGVDVVHVRRGTREGFKAGALAHGLATAKGELVAVFDADFVPPKDFLRRVLPAFADPGVGMVQARWGHLNRDESWLTRAQAVFLDAHFSVEHLVRSSRRRFFNFNGTAGVWRRSAIDAAGGWDAATLTEDLDLSVRAQLAGSRFVYVDDVEVPAELPADVLAFKSQQHRWAKGSAQTALKLLGDVWRADVPLATKIDATSKLGQNFAFLALAVVVATLPVAAVERALGTGPLARAADVSTLGLATLPVAAYFVAALRLRARSFVDVAASVPLALAVGAALSVNNARAVVEGLFGFGERSFVRTPKRGAGPALYASPARVSCVVELALGAWHVATAAWLAAAGHALTTPFLWTTGVGLLLLGAGSLRAPTRAVA